MSSDRPKKLFKVASEFNVSTQTIVDSLSERGYTVANRPNSNVTGEMVAVLEEIYGVDKAKNLEHDRHREEYEHRRSYLGGGRADSLKPDQGADFGPAADLQPLGEPGLEPLEEPGLLPLDEPGLEPLEEPGLEPLEEPGLAPVDEPGLEPLEEPALEAEGEEESVPEPVADEPVPAMQESPSPEPVIAAEAPKVADSPEEPTLTPAEEIEPDQAPSGATATADGKPEAEETGSAPEDAAVSSEQPEAPEAEVQAPEASGTGAESVVRAKADRLKGTKILGKVKINRDDFAGTGVRPAAKRKRKKDLLPGESAVKTPAATTTAASSADKKRKKGKKGKTDSVQVGRSVRETMQQIQLGASVTGKRAKRRRQRREERMEEAELAQIEQQISEGTIEVSEYVTVSDLAQLLDVKPNDVIMTCMSIGSMVSINQRLDANIIELVASEYGRDVHFVDAEELTDEQLTEEEDAPEDLETRAPIITVMGHVDHGKTSLLDYIRKSKVAAGEAGGITQHVGAYEVTTRDGRRITFLDTPGHEAFTAMRSRGAQATDIVILVVAADDSVMPQTIEAINHAKAAEVPVVVAINKIDKDGANPDRIKQQLSEHGLIVEEWGGETQCANVSAKSGQGIDELLDKVLIESELLDLKANPNRRASGIVLESRIDKGKGIVSNVLVQKGTLKIGDPFVAGPCYGRVRAMEDEWGQRITEAGPSVPVQLTGFDDIPQAGDRMLVLKDEKTAKEIASQRQQIKREQTLRKTKHLTLDDLSRRMALGELSELNLILKADVDGSIEALSGSLQKLSTDEVAVNIIHTGSGAITESDVLLASASDAIIIGFQVRPTTSARKLAESESIDIRLFSVIYDAIDEVRDALEGMLQPEFKEQIRGTADVREVFRITKIGTIAGCYVIDGKIERPNPVRIIRDGIVIFNGQIDSLKRFKDDVKEVATGYECGISIQNFNDLKVGDQIESYMVTEEKRKLEEVR